MLRTRQTCKENCERFIRRVAQNELVWALSNDHGYACCDSFGTDEDSKIRFQGSSTIWNLVNGDFYFQDNNTTRFTFGRTTGDFTATGDITSSGGAYYKNNLAGQSGAVQFPDGGYYSPNEGRTAGGWALVLLFLALAHRGGDDGFGFYTFFCAADGGNTLVTTAMLRLV